MREWLFRRTAILRLSHTLVCGLSCRSPAASSSFFSALLADGGDNSLSLDEDSGDPKSDWDPGNKWVGSMTLLWLAERAILRNVFHLFSETSPNFSNSSTAAGSKLVLLENPLFQIRVHPKSICNESLKWDSNRSRILEKAEF